jgi:hypothetical protein
VPRNWRSEARPVAAWATARAISSSSVASPRGPYRGAGLLTDATIRQALVSGLTGLIARPLADGYPIKNKVVELCIHVARRRVGGQVKGAPTEYKCLSITLHLRSRVRSWMSPMNLCRDRHVSSRTEVPMVEVRSCDALLR